MEILEFEPQTSFKREKFLSSLRGKITMRLNSCVILNLFFRLMQDATLKHITAELEKVKATPKVDADVNELSRTKGALEATMAKLADAEKQLETRYSMMKELERTLEETREELARERSYVAQAFDNDEEMIRIKEELQKAETQTKMLEKHLAGKDEVISSLKKDIENAKATSLEKNSQAEEKEKTISDKVVEVAALAEELNEAKEELHCTKAELVKVKVDSTDKDSQLEKLRKDLNDKVSELEDDSRKNSDAVAALEDVKKQCLEKEAELNIFREMSSKTVTDALTEIGQQLEEFTKALDKKNSQVIARNNTIKRLEMALAEKERLLSDMEKLPKEPNLRAKEELKTLRRRLVQADKEREESRELLAKKEEKLEEAQQALEKLTNDRDEKSAKFLRELQDTRTELAEAKEDTKKKQEQIQSLKEKLDSQSLKNACLQTQLENEKRGLLEKETGFQEVKELSSAKSSSASERDEARMRLASTEAKVQEMEDEVLTANETTCRIQDEMRKYQNEVVPALEIKVKALEEEVFRSGERVKVSFLR